MTCWEVNGNDYFTGHSNDRYNQTVNPTVSTGITAWAIRPEAAPWPPPPPPPKSVEIDGPSTIFTDGSSYEWTAETTGFSNPDYQWERKYIGFSWTNVGTNSDTYSLSGATQTFELRVTATEDTSSAQSPEFFVYVKPLTVVIEGLINILVNESNQWTAIVESGESPYDYEWKRKDDGESSWSSVGTSSSYTSNSHTVDFDLKIVVTDDCDSTAAASITVTVSYPPLDVEIDAMTFEHIVYDWANSFWAVVSGGAPDYSYEWYMEVDESEWELVCEDSIYNIEHHDWEDLEELFPTLEIGSYLDLKLIVTDIIEESEYDIVYDLEVVEAQKKIALKPMPKDFKLEQNYPNPFNPVTTINFQLPKASNVTLVIYDIQGREIARLVDGYVGAGYHSVPWKPVSASSGIYIYRLQAGSFSDIKRMLYIK